MALGDFIINAADEAVIADGTDFIERAHDHASHFGASVLTP
jgi:hypothetical protein